MKLGKMLSQSLTNKLYKAFTELDRNETIALWAFGSNGVISGFHSKTETAESYCKKEELDYLKKQRFNLNNPKVRKIIDSVLKKHKKSLKIAEMVWERVYRVDRNLFVELLYKLLTLKDNPREFMINTGVDEDTLFRLLRVLLNNKIIDLNNRGVVVNIFLKPLRKGRIRTSLPRRIPPDVAFDQYFCTWETSLRRAEKLIKDGLLENKKILFVGDDDLTSIALSRRINAEVHVFDLDDKILSTIDSISGKEGLSIKTHKGDVRTDLPSSLKARFDIFFCDPTYTLVGMESFIFRGWQALKKEEGVRGYVSFCPYFMGKHAYLVEKFILDLGFKIEEIIKSFNEYPPFNKPDYFWKLLEKDFGVTTLSIRREAFLHSDLFVLKLVHPEVGNKVTLHKGDLYDYVYLI